MPSILPIFNDRKQKQKKHPKHSSPIPSDRTNLRFPHCGLSILPSRSITQTNPFCRILTPIGVFPPVTLFLPPFINMHSDRPPIKHAGRKARLEHPFGFAQQHGTWSRSNHEGFPLMPAWIPLRPFSSRRTATL